MVTRVDIRAELEDLGIRTNSVFSGMRPAIQIKEDYLTASLIEFEGEKKKNGKQDVKVMFLAPRHYPNSVWLGKRMEMYDGSKVIGYIAVTEIVNPILDSSKEKWVLLDGRKIHTMQQFYEQVQQQIARADCQIVQNMNAFNDVLWGGFGVHEYEEPLHIVWIFSNESRQYLGEDNFSMIINTINNHESGNKYLELYDEHTFE